MNDPRSAASVTDGALPLGGFGGRQLEAALQGLECRETVSTIDGARGGIRLLDCAADSFLPGYTPSLGRAFDGPDGSHVQFNGCAASVRIAKRRLPDRTSLPQFRNQVASPAHPCFPQLVASEIKKCRLGLLGSGKGSNMAAIAEACARADSPMEIRLVLSDVPDAGILEKARSRGIPHQYVPPGKFRTKLDEESERQYIQLLQAAQVDYVALAGFMRILKGDFLKTFPHRVVNIHPSLLPSFPGLAAWNQALEYGVKFTGCTVHLVDQGVDTGPILGQRAVPVLDEDSAETLHERIQQAERVLYPEVLENLALGKYSVAGRRCKCAR